MAVRHILTQGVGFEPGSTALIPTLGFSVGEEALPEPREVPLALSASGAVRRAVDVFQGEDVELVCRVASRNITGWKVRFAVAEGEAGETVYLNKHVGAGIALSRPSAGEFTVSLSSAELDALEPGTYLWMAGRADDGESAVLGWGPFRVRGDAGAAG